MPIISSKLISYLEKDYILQDALAIDNAEAIVVLSGMLKTIKVDDKLKYEFSGIEIKIPNDFNDRIVIIGKVNIFKKNKIGFYEYHLNISGEFLDEFYVFSE